MTADAFLSVKTFQIVFLGLVAFMFGTAAGRVRNDVGSPLFVIWPVAPTG
jgi:Na+-transporting methylmalonyl-CoA/oxaloacetate decarboxylase beta subunit